MLKHSDQVLNQLAIKQSLANLVLRWHAHQLAINRVYIMLGFIDMTFSIVHDAEIHCIYAS
jgi:hypothetical protein